ncbi:MAG: DUF5694 domain-containing protein [Gemmatimonadetes bacterium]|nr:DUF5694 domain-containing protein [Gemmatimonadota bacterium]
MSRLGARIAALALGLLCGGACRPARPPQQLTPLAQRPIEVLLLGTFHFAQVDTLTYDVLRAPRAAEVSQVVDALVEWAPDKVFLEWQPEFNQALADSLLLLHRRDGALARRNEVYQLGVRTAARLGHPRTYLIDHPGRFGALRARTVEVAQQLQQEHILDGGAPFTYRGFYEQVDSDALRLSQSLPAFLRYLNSPAYRVADHAGYISRYPRIGFVATDLSDTAGVNRAGAELVADWYRRNVMIFGKALRWMDFRERRVVIVIGAGHVPILRHLFESHGGFRVVEVASVIRAP